MKYVTCIILLLGFVCLTGCGPSKYPPDWPKTYPCTITVTKGGQPLEGATVIMDRIENHGSWAVSGLTNASGVAEIMTSWTKASTKGAPEGTFKITLSKAESPFVSSKSDAELEAMPYDMRTAFLATEQAKARANPSIPRVLADPAVAKAQIEVKPGTPATLTIEVDDYR